MALVVLLTLGGIGFGSWYFLKHSAAARPDLLLHPVKKELLQITIVDRGSIESAENNEIVCKVKAKAQGASATNIRWVIDNGVTVRKGDKVAELDDSALQTQFIDQQITMEKALGDWDKAKEQLKINESTSNQLIKQAEVALKVAEITAQEYLDGTYEQARLDFENKLTMSHSDLTMWQERAGWSERMSRPGRQFVTVAQAEADEARRLSAKLTQDNLLKQYDVLKTLTKKKNQIDFEGKVEVAVLALKTEKSKAQALRSQDDSACRTTKLTYEKELGKLRDLEKELENCDLRAPKSGMIVYWIEERSRWGGGKQRIIAQGEAVDEGQKLMSIPNLSRMVVNARVHEAMAPRVRPDVKEETGFSSIVEFGLYLQPNPLAVLSTEAAFRTDLKTPFLLTPEHRQAEQKLIRHGQEARVRVSAFPDHSLRGHVTSIATVASVNDLFASDVKVYQTYVSIDETLEGIKPGMDAEVTILVDATPESVLAVPLQAVMGGVEKGQKRKCYVMTPEGPRMREITLGKSNEKMVEVKEGIEEGDVVVVNPVVLLTEKEKLEYGTLPTRPSKGGPGSWGGKGKGGGKGMQGGGMEGGGMQGGPKQGGGMQGGPKQGGGMQGGPKQGGGTRQGKKGGGAEGGPTTAGGG